MVIQGLMYKVKDKSVGSLRNEDLHALETSRVHDQIVQSLAVSQFTKGLQTVGLDTESA